MKFAMVLNSCAAAGFLILIAADLISLRGKGSEHTFLRGCGYAIVLLSLGLFALAPQPNWPFAAQGRVPPGGAAGALGAAPGRALSPLFAIIAAISGALLIWSVFIEIGATRKSRQLSPNATVDTGSYGVCRHPGFWWYALLALSLSAWRGLDTYLFPAIFMIALDFILVLIQDVYIFPNIFPGYDDYKKSVPFLIPRRKRGAPMSR
jgi:protein-S-isoprenylcysteine O-methyltransferase Ste14